MLFDHRTEFSLSVNTSRSSDSFTDITLEG
jgi:hypothetical protein